MVARDRPSRRTSWWPTTTTSTNLLNTLPDAYQVLSRQGLYGDFFSFYLCDVVLKLNGKGGQPVYVKVAGQYSGRCTPQMKSFSERNPFVIGAVGVGLTARGDGRRAQLRQASVPQRRTRTTRPTFAEAGGLIPGAPVQVSGFEVGKVDSIELDGARVLVTFNVDKDVRLGDRTEAAIKTKSLLGAKILEVTPRGDGEQTGPIPLDRTTPAYQLPDATRRSDRGDQRI